MTEPRRPADPSASAADSEHDAWLREALRHAPDSALSPPALLRDSILSQARAAVAAAAPPRVANPAALRPAQRQSAFSAWWSWLARPPVAAGFASVMAATLVGLMWWDRPMDEAMPQPPSLSQPPASPSPSLSLPGAAPSPAAEPLPMQKATAPPPAARQPVAPPIVARRAVPPAADFRTQAEATASGAERDTAVPFPAEAKEERREAKSAARDALKKDDRPASPAAAEPAPMPARPAPAPALADNLGGGSDKERAAPERARQATGATAPSGRLDAARDAGAPGAIAQAGPGADLQAAPRRSESAVAAKLARSAAVARPLASLLSTAAADASRLTRIGGDGRVVAADDALLRWLGELDAVTAGFWQGLDAPADRAGSGLDLRIDGQPAATITVETSTVTLSSRAGTVPRLWRAEVGAAAAERLRNGRPR